MNNFEQALDRIIDAIESNAPKLAMELCQKALKKWPNSLQVNALKSLVLFNSGRVEDASILALEVVSGNPKDYFTISVIERIFESQSIFKPIIALCENSLKCVFNCSIAEALFLNYLRCNETSKLFGVARKLYMESNNEKYLFWAILSLILDSRNTSTDQQKPGYQIDLALKFLDKLDISKSDSTLFSQFKQLRILVCGLACDYSKLREILEQKEPHDASENSTLLVDTLIKLESYEEAADFSKELSFKESNVDLSIWDCILRLSPKVSSEHRFALDLLNNYKQIEGFRGTDLAAIELKLQFPKSLSLNLTELLYSFIKTNKARPSTLNDCVYFINRMRLDDIESFSELAFSHINAAKDILEESTFLHIQRFLSQKFKISYDMDAKQLDRLSSVYAELDRLEPVSNAGQDGAKMSSLALYRCLNIIDEYLFDGKSEKLHIVASLLARYSLIFEDEYVFGLLSILVSIATGSISNAFKHFKSLDIKCLQLDTLGYFVSDFSIYLGGFEELDFVYSQSSSLYLSNFRDTWSLIERALHAEKYISVLEFYGFSEKLTSSIQMASFEISHFRALVATRPVEEIVELLKSKSVLNVISQLAKVIGSPKDNRDYGVLAIFDPCESVYALIPSSANFSVQDLKFYYNFLILARKKASETEFEFPLAEKYSLDECSDKYAFSIIRLLSEQFNAESFFSLVLEALDDELSQILENYNHFSKYLLYKDISLFGRFLSRYRELSLVVAVSRGEFSESSSILSHFRNKLEIARSLFAQYSSNLVLEHKGSSKSVELIKCWFENNIY